MSMPGAADFADWEKTLFFSRGKSRAAPWCKEGAYMPYGESGQITDKNAWC